MATRKVAVLLRGISKVGSECHAVEASLCGPRSQAKRTLREVDINGDGRISKEEFHHMLTGSPVPDSLDQYDARVFLEH